MNVLPIVCIICYSEQATSVSNNDRFKTYKVYAWQHIVQYQRLICALESVIFMGLSHWESDLVRHNYVSLITIALAISILNERLLLIPKKYFHCFSHLNR